MLYLGLISVSESVLIRCLTCKLSTMTSYFPGWQHLKDVKDKDPIMEGVLLETENMLARGRLDLPLSLCFATLRGDDLLLHQLLKRGLDPNESDNNGRTSLVSSIFCCSLISLSTDHAKRFTGFCIFSTLFPFLGFPIYVIPAYSSIKRKRELCASITGLWSGSQQ